MITRVDGRHVVQRSATSTPDHQPPTYMAVGCRLCDNKLYNKIVLPVVSCLLSVTRVNI